MRFWIAYLGIVASALAQTGTVSGIAVDASTGAPLRGVVVRLTGSRVGSQPPPLYTATSGADGKFSVEGIPPATYRLDGMKAGFTGARLGGAGTVRNGSVFTLGPGQEIASAEVRMEPQASFTGRVLDENGDPVSRAFVQAMRVEYISGRFALASRASATTNDIGEYRLGGLTAGDYTISARKNPPYSNVQIIDRSPEGLKGRLYVDVFYPGTTDAAKMKTIQARGGSETKVPDLKLVRQQTRAVRGRVVNNTGIANAPVMAALLPEDEFRPVDSVLTPVGANRQFEFLGQLPGKYLLKVSVGPPANVFTAYREIEIGSADIGDLVMEVTRGSEILGSLTVEGSLSTDFGRLLVGIQMAVPAQVGVHPARVANTGAVRMDGVTPGIYHAVVVVPRVLAPLYPKSVLYGGKDVRDQAFEITDKPERLEIVLGTHPGQVTGTVVDGSGKPAVGAAVTLVPESITRQADVQFYKEGMTDPNGVFTIDGVEPGSYRAYASLREIPFTNPEAVQPFREQGVAVVIGEGTRQTVRLPLVSATN